MLDVRSLTELCTAQTPASAQGSRLKSRLRRYQRSTYVTRHSFLPWSRTRSRLNSTLARESGSDRIGEEAQALPDDARLTRVRRKRAHYFRVLSLDGVGTPICRALGKIAWRSGIDYYEDRVYDVGRQLGVFWGLSHSSIYVLLCCSRIIDRSAGDSSTERCTGRLGPVCLNRRTISGNQKPTQRTLLLDICGIVAGAGGRQQGYRRWGSALECLGLNHEPFLGLFGIFDSLALLSLSQRPR
jgi:hypothetical protein